MQISGDEIRFCIVAVIDSGAGSKVKRTFKQLSLLDRKVRLYLRTGEKTSNS
jgi:hypothetical protein